jgi:UDP-N-acetyl-D-galactosamine dehydrogenase
MTLSQLSESREDERVAVIGLGYVGLPVALAFGEAFDHTVGFDISSKRVSALVAGHDETLEVSTEALELSTVSFTDDPEAMRGATLFVVTVPTPVHGDGQPDLSALLAASATVGRVLSTGAVVVFESTVYPGVTEDVCGPEIARVSGLRLGVDFKLAYSPERINPGDQEHTLPRIIKVVGAQDAESLERVAGAYARIVPAGIHRTSSIRVAEAAKVIENTQRDLNIAFMNELALIFERLSIPTREVLEAASTKWNFLPFRPGLVGGHCIGVDPYYLTSKAQAVGYHPEVILAGRRINDSMGSFVAQKLVRLLVDSGRPITGARVGVLGLTFKENVPDLRNSGVPGILTDLQQFGIDAIVHDPLASSAEAKRLYDVTLEEREALRDLDALVLAVPHKAALENAETNLSESLRPGGVLVDVCSALSPGELRDDVIYWSL